MTDLRARKIKHYGWKRDLPDFRDYKFLVAYNTTTSLPTTVDLRPACPPVYDQLALGSCTANAIAAAVQFDRKKQNLLPDFVPSRLFVYYNERVIEGDVGQDNGAQIRDGFKSIAKLGVPPETDWPYNINKFTQKPPKQAFIHGLQHKAVVYSSLSNDAAAMKTCLASGYPFVFGFSVYSSFESDQVAKTGIVPMPALSEEMLGGHAVLAVGYDDQNQYFIVRNSWGPNWGIKGYFTIPYGYLTNPQLASDFWTVKTIST